MIAGLKDAIERRAGASISDKDLAKLLVLDPSSISRWQDGGSTSLAAVLTALTEVDGQWSAFGRLVTWPDRSIAALTEAVGFSRHRLQRHRKEETISRNSRDYELPTRSEFEGLLWLFLNPEWFDPESTIECRDQLALAISKSAAKRIRSDSGGAEDQGLRAELDRCERFANVSDLQRLQARWGEAWMIAIEKRGYNWRV
jgi:hypothetical protein